MAVLTSPPRRRPRFGPQAGLVAATRGVAFAALMAAGIGLLLMIVAAVFLIALGAGILIVGNGGPRDQRVLLAFLAIGTGLGLIRFALPASQLAIRRLARPARQQARDWWGVPAGAAAGCPAARPAARAGSGPTPCRRPRRSADHDSHG